MIYIKNCFSTLIWIAFAVIIITGYTASSLPLFMTVQSYSASIVTTAACLAVVTCTLIVVALLLKRKQIVLRLTKRTVRVVELSSVMILIGAGIYFHMHKSTQLLFGGHVELGLYDATNVHPFILLLAGSICYYCAIRKVLNFISAIGFLIVSLFGYTSFLYTGQYNKSMLLYALSGLTVFAMYQCVATTSRLLLYTLWSFLASVFAMTFLSMDALGGVAVLACIMILSRQCYKTKGSRIELFFVGVFGIVTMVLVGCLLDELILVSLNEVYAHEITVTGDIVSYLVSQQYYIYIWLVAILTFLIQSNKGKISIMMLLIIMIMLVSIFGIHTYLPLDYMMQLLSVTIFMYVLKIYMPEITIIEKDHHVIVEQEPVSEIFIPKEMQIPRRAEKPKLEYAKEESEFEMKFDVEVDESSDYDI